MFSRDRKLNNGDSPDDNPSYEGFNIACCHIMTILFPWEMKRRPNTELDFEGLFFAKDHIQVFTKL